ncbi:MAG: hypothetical protein ACOCVH_00025 [Verrucomicrobiota bacterium]
MNTKRIQLLLPFLVALLLVAGCEIDDSESGDSLNTPDEISQDDGASAVETSGPARAAVSIDTVPLAGEYVPDPVLVKYEFVFNDGTLLQFRENHGGDYWGEYPSAGWGQVVNPDGSTRGVDVNTIVRKGGLHIARTPVTTLDHGRRMFWMADVEGVKDMKRVDIFEDGWNPLVEGAVLATQDQLGIGAGLVSCHVIVERRK